MSPSFVDRTLLPPEPLDAPDPAVSAVGLRLVADVELRAWGNGLLDRVLMPPARGLVVVEAMRKGAALRDLALEACRADGLALLLSAAAAWTMEPAEVLTYAVIRRWRPLWNRKDVIRLAVHEALVNAAMHGCFRIPAALRRGPEGWLAHTAAVETALRDPERSHQPVLLTVVPDPSGTCWAFMVADAGPGFDVEATLAEPPDQSQTGLSLRGRGLRLMQAAVNKIAWEDEGRRVRMTVCAPTV